MKRLEEQLGEAGVSADRKAHGAHAGGRDLAGICAALARSERRGIERHVRRLAQWQRHAGGSHDVAETWLPAVVEGFSAVTRPVALRTVEGRSTAVFERLAAGEIDLAVAFTAARAEDALWSGCLPMIWIGPRDFVSKRNSPVQLAVFDPPCAFRSAATATLDQAGIDWSVAYSSSSLSDLWAAVNIGLGVTVRTPAALPPALRSLAAMPGCPTCRRCSFRCTESMTRRKRRWSTGCVHCCRRAWKPVSAPPCRTAIRIAHLRCVFADPACRRRC